MVKGKSQFTGLSGEYYIAYCLTVREFHASLTVGNAPNIDVLVSSPDGLNHISIQVKTSRWAYRKNRYGFEVWEWDVGPSAVGRSGDNLWYAFVDLQEKDGNYSPQVFLVPSLWVSDFVQPEWKRKMYLLKVKGEEYCHERWDLINKYFGKNREALNWVKTIPNEVKWKS